MQDEIQHSSANAVPGLTAGLQEPAEPSWVVQAGPKDEILHTVAAAAAAVAGEGDAAEGEGYSSDEVVEPHYVPLPVRPAEAQEE